MLAPTERAPNSRPSPLPLPSALLAAELGPVVMADDPCEAAFGSATPTGARNYYRARYYDPKLGRFLSEDPIRWFGGINLYPYVDNNPTNFVDPTGLLKGPDPFTTITGVCEATVGTATTTATTTIGLVFLATSANVGADFEPGEPRPPTCDKTDTCNRGDDNSFCDKLRDLCLEQPTQNQFRQKQWGKRKDCGACYRHCKRLGWWPYDKCPLFENR